MVKVCECCGQPLQDVREGVRLTPMKARIFDMIKARPGITRREICAEIYPTVSQAGVYTVGSHVKQLRDLFAHKNITIRGEPYLGGYKITKRLIRAAG